MIPFTHLHVHSQFSLLDGQAAIDKLVDKAIADGQKGIALTDHGNMFGAVKFYEILKKNGIKPIIGCELYLDYGLDDEKNYVNDLKYFKNEIYHIVVLCENKEGYKNLVKQT